MYFCLHSQSTVLLWAQLSAQCLDYSLCKTRNRWRSIDTHFHDGVTYMTSTDSVDKAAISSYMNYCNKKKLRLTKMQDRKLLTHQWCWFWGWGWEYIAIVFACKGGQWLIYGCWQAMANYITQDARPKIVDTVLMLMFGMGQGLCRNCFCPYRRPISPLWMFATNCLLDYTRYKTKRDWHSDDAHF